MPAQSGGAEGSTISHTNPDTVAPEPPIVVAQSNQKTSPAFEIPISISPANTPITTSLESHATPVRTTSASVEKQSLPTEAVPITPAFSQSVSTVTEQPNPTTPTQVLSAESRPSMERPVPKRAKRVVTRGVDPLEITKLKERINNDPEKFLKLVPTDWNLQSSALEPSISSARRKLITDHPERMTALLDHLSTTNPVLALQIALDINNDRPENISEEDRDAMLRRSTEACIDQMEPEDFTRLILSSAHISEHPWLVETQGPLHKSFQQIETVDRLMSALDSLAIGDEPSWVDGIMHDCIVNLKHNDPEEGIRNLHYYVTRPWAQAEMESIEGITTTHAESLLVYGASNGKLETYSWLRSLIEQALPIVLERDPFLILRCIVPEELKLPEYQAWAEQTTAIAAVAAAAKNPEEFLKTIQSSQHEQSWERNGIESIARNRNYAGIVLEKIRQDRPYTLDIARSILERFPDVFFEQFEELDWLGSALKAPIDATLSRHPDLALFNSYILVHRNENYLKTVLLAGEQDPTTVLACVQQLRQTAGFLIDQYKGGDHADMGKEKAQQIENCIRSAFTKSLETNAELTIKLHTVYDNQPWASDDIRKAITPLAKTNPAFVLSLKKELNQWPWAVDLIKKLESTPSTPKPKR